MTPRQPTDFHFRFLPLVVAVCNIFQRVRLAVFGHLMRANDDFVALPGEGGVVVLVLGGPGEIVGDLGATLVATWQGLGLAELVDHARNESDAVDTALADAALED